ncbi:MAG: ribokinase [Verrucomicrobiales bacterium]|nr:ribokinase [Verrucomicrobiales bacterium]MCP5526615.1 ribokinase [Verrucomicrobiales bacterium]
MNPKVVVVGSSNTDMVLRVPRLPAPGETVLGGEFLSAAGGKGANQAVAAARLGGRVTFVARVGTDAFGEAARRGFEREGIDTTHVRGESKRLSGVALIFVARSGENSIGVAPGANACLSAADVRRAQKAIDHADVVLTQLEIPWAAVSAAIETAKARGRKVILNPAPATRIPRSLLRAVDVLTPNEAEAAALSGMEVADVDSAVRAAQGLRRRGAGAVVVTLGGRGAVVVSSDVCEHVPAFGVKAVDTTAAGDVFNGALAVALGEGRNLLDAVRFASAAAAISVTVTGAQPSAPKRPAVERFLRARR